jgi:Cu(I)/Ag(I) efflux system membrane protein CusA/SilA
VINLKPVSQWRPGMTVEKLKGEMNDALNIPGVANSFTMPIKARIDMLATGIRTPAGIKILGPDLEQIEKIGMELETYLRDIPGTRSVYAERVATGYYLDVVIQRDRIARYGLTVDDVNAVVQAAIGGSNLTTTIEGRARYPVNIRYPRELRNDVDKLKRILVPVVSPARVSEAAPSFFTATNGILQVPMGELADFRIIRGPTAIKSEEGLLVSYVYIDISDRDIGSYVEEAREKTKALKLPEGYRLVWSGEYENILETRERLKVVIPFTLLIIIVILFLSTRSAIKTTIVLLAVPFSLIGSFWFLYLLNYNMSTAVWVGIIALAGLDAETGVIMLLYLDMSYDKWKKEGLLKTRNDLKDAIMHGAVKRIRPKVMTGATILAGLIPVMFSDGPGADVMKRIAAPMIGGIVTSTLLELLIYPTIYLLWRERSLKKEISGEK